MAESIYEALDQTVREEFNPMVEDTLPELDPFWRNVYSSAEGVERSGLGRDFKFKQVYFGSVSGVNRFTEILRDSSADDYFTPDSANPETNMTAVVTGFHVYPDPRGSIRPKRWIDEVQLARFEGNLSLDGDIMQVDAIDANIGSHVMDIMRGHSIGVTHAYTHGLYNNDDTTRAFYQVNGSPTNTTNTSTFSVDNGRLYRAPVGTRVSVYDTGGAAVITNTDTTEVVVIDKIDYLAETVTIRVLSGVWEPDGTGTPATTVDDNDWIYLYDSYGMSINGFETYMKNSGTVRNMNLTNFPQFRSLVTNVAGPLTRTELVKNIGAFIDRYRTLGYSVDSIITTQGVVNTYMINHEGAIHIETNGRKIDLSESGYEGEVAFWYNGKKYRFLISAMVANQTAYITKLADNNWKRLLAPSPGGFKGINKDDVPSEVQWVAPAFGLKGAFAPYFDTSTGALTNGVQAPYEAIGQIAPKQIPGIILTGLTETLVDAA